MVTDELASRLDGAAHEPWRAQQTLVRSVDTGYGTSVELLRMLLERRALPDGPIQCRPRPFRRCRPTSHEPLHSIFINEIGSEFCFSFVLGLF